MCKWLIGFSLGMAICFGSANAAIAETYTLEPITVVGLGVDKDSARDQAKGLRDDIVEIYDDDTGGAVVGVNSTYTWDGVAYEITFEIIVTFDDD